MQISGQVVCTRGKWPIEGDSRVNNLMIVWYRRSVTQCACVQCTQCVLNERAGGVSNDSAMSRHASDSSLALTRSTHGEDTLNEFGGIYCRTVT